METNLPQPETQSGVEIAPGIYVPPKELRFHFARSGGPGGQNVNKVNTKAELKLSLNVLRNVLRPPALGRLQAAAANKITLEGDLQIVADTERSQDANRQQCMARLRALLLSILPEPKLRRKTRPSRGAKERRLESKRAHSAIKKERRERNRGPQ